jgi:hypothetical protein
MRSPAAVFCGKESDKVLAEAEAAVAATCADEIGTTVPIVSVKVACPEPPLLVAVKVTVEVPALVGVPEINPLLAFTDSPAGKPLAPKLVGEFVATI